MLHLGAATEVVPGSSSLCTQLIMYRPDLPRAILLGPLSVPTMCREHAVDLLSKRLLVLTSTAPRDREKGMELETMFYGWSWFV